MEEKNARTAWMIDIDDRHRIEDTDGYSIHMDDRHRIEDTDVFLFECQTVTPADSF